MLAIKLQRIGKKHQPSYRVVVQEKREKLNGRSVEDVGWYNPLLDKSEYKKERILHWIKIGAQPTDTVWNLFVTAGILEGKKIAKHKKSRIVEDSKKEESGILTPDAVAGVGGVPDTKTETAPTGTLPQKPAEEQAA